MTKEAWQKKCREVTALAKQYDVKYWRAFNDWGKTTARTKLWFVNNNKITDLLRLCGAIRVHVKGVESVELRMTGIEIVDSMHHPYSIYVHYKRTKDPR